MQAIMELTRNLPMVWLALTKNKTSNPAVNSGPNPETGCNQIIPHAEMINIAFVGEAIPVKQLPYFLIQIQILPNEAYHK